MWTLRSDRKKEGSHIRAAILLQSMVRQQAKPLQTLEIDSAEESCSLIVEESTMEHEADLK